jgi:hypothetical protein
MWAELTVWTLEAKAAFSWAPPFLGRALALGCIFLQLLQEFLSPVLFAIAFGQPLGALGFRGVHGGV